MSGTSQPDNSVVLQGSAGSVTLNLYNDASGKYTSQGNAAFEFLQNTQSLWLNETIANHGNKNVTIDIKLDLTLPVSGRAKIISAGENTNVTALLLNPEKTINASRVAGGAFSWNDFLHAVYHEAGHIKRPYASWTGNHPLIGWGNNHTQVSPYELNGQQLYN